MVRHSVGCSAFSRRHSVVALLAPVAEEEEEALQHVDACMGGVAMINKQTNNVECLARCLSFFPSLFWVSQRHLIGQLGSKDRKR